MADLSVNEESLAVDEIIAAGPGGNHLGRAYTRRHYRDFWQPELFDHAIFERWNAQGANTLKERVKEKTDRLRAEDRAFVLDGGVSMRLSQLLAEELAARGTTS